MQYIIVFLYLYCLYLSAKRRMVQLFACILLFSLFMSEIIFNDNIILYIKGSGTFCSLFFYLQFFLFFSVSVICILWFVWGFCSYNSCHSYSILWHVNTTESYHTTIQRTHIAITVIRYINFKPIYLEFNSSHFFRLKPQGY